MSAARLGFLALLAIALTSGGLLAWEQFSVTSKARGWVQHTYEVLDAIRGLEGAVDEAEIGQRSYLLTGDASYLEPYARAIQRIPALQHTLQAMTVDNAGQQERLAALWPLVAKRLDILASAVRRAGENDQAGALNVVRSGEGQQASAQLRAILADATSVERDLLAKRLDRAAAADHFARWAALALAGTAILILALAVYGLRKALARTTQAEAAQRRTAELLDRCLRSLTHGIAVFDSAFRLSHVNPAFGQLLDLSEEHLREGRAYAELAAQLAAGGIEFLENEEQIRATAADAAGASAIGYDRSREPGPRSYEIRRTWLPDGGFVLTLIETTERLRAEALLREANKMQAIGRLTGGIAHDFNNLLMVILGNLGWLRTRLPDQPAMAERLDRAIWGAERGATLTRQLLAFARREPLEPKPVDVGALVREITGLLGRTLGETVQISLIDSAGLWPALVDPVRLESALLNLALNSRDAMPDGGRLTIELGNRAINNVYAAQHLEVTPGDYVLVAVSDTGTGMPPEVAERAFEPFYTTKGESHGTGLGLSMVHGFVKQLGGHITLYSEVGVGTTVKLYLPRARNSALQPLPAPPLKAGRRGATVLLVEDDSGVRDVAAAMLAELGYGVIQAGDVPSALAVATAQPNSFDLLLADVILPMGVGGHELARRLRMIRPELPVLYMSGYTANAIVHQGRLDEGVTLLNKPFSRHELADALAKLLPPGSASGHDGGA